MAIVGGVSAVFLRGSSHQKFCTTGYLTHKPAWRTAERSTRLISHDLVAYGNNKQNTHDIHTMSGMDVVPLLIPMSLMTPE